MTTAQSPSHMKNNMNSNMKSPARAPIGIPLWPIGVAAVGVAALLAFCFGTEAPVREQLVLLNRYLARLSFLFFIPIYAASPLRVWRPNDTTRRLVGIRRSLGLGYALIMGAHLLAIGGLQQMASSEPIDLATAIGGGLGFVFIAALAATSNDASIRLLGAKAWKRMHRIALHWLWVIYAITYVGRIFDPAEDRGLEYLPGLVTVFGLLALRVSARFRRSA
jgi:sulfoxide reductase heme-binding subunit YedZ